MTKILGLDLGTNSIGWALINQSEDKNEIIKIGSRIIPMSQDILGKFDSGQSISQTAERTGYRGVRRLRERYLLRRERLHRVLNILNFLPKHFADEIDFERRFGQIKKGKEPKIAYDLVDGNFDFIFKNAFAEMLAEFRERQPLLLEDDKKIPYDWTIYYLRKKALTQKIDKEELAWLILHFNQKRGYYQLRGEEEEENPNKLVEFHSLKVINIEEDTNNSKKDEKWYSFHLENGWIYRRSSKTPLDWLNKTKDFIVTTDLNDDGTIKTDKEGNEKRSFRAPADTDWTLVKKKTEAEIYQSNKTVGQFIYDTLLENPTQKIKGSLVRTIERKFYKQELIQILETQEKLNPELQNKDLYQACCEELYEQNESHRISIQNKSFTHLFVNDIIFYQRPLKSKKSTVSDCKFEFRCYEKEGVKQKEFLKCTPKSHPLYQEFRLLQFLQNLKIYTTEEEQDVTSQFLKSTEDWENLFDWLNNRKDVEQKSFLNYPAFGLKKNASKYRWNYVPDKAYPCNETRAQILSRLDKAGIDHSFLDSEITEHLWHILYSVTDKFDIEKALSKFAIKHNLNSEFVTNFKTFPPFKSDFGAFSTKALKKLLPLVRFGKYWNKEAIHTKTLERIDKIINGEFDDKIRDRVREKTINLTTIHDFCNLPTWLVSYVVYDRHSEDGEALKWNTPNDIERYLKDVFKQHSLRNPIVEQVIAETLRVVKDIWQLYGEGSENFFDEIHVELGRSMKNPAKIRESMTKTITENENTNVRIKAMLMEFLNDGNFENVRPFSPSQQEILKIYEDGVLNSSIEIPEDILKISKQAQPTNSELTKYKLWLQQKYRSPYTNAVIPLNKLFTPAYEIEHIIPQSRYFDDSFSNKVICEAAVNKEKDNQLALEFIAEKGGKIIELGNGQKVKILSKEDYEEVIKNNFANNRGKMKKLLMDSIPEAFIQRQLNDTRYISKVVKNLLSNIVREKDEQETVSKNLISTTGAITSTLKQDWGLNDIWNDVITPRFERLNEITQSQKFGSINPNTNKFLPQVPIELQKGFNKKRIDHRHHALDALVIACATRDHVNYLNNESALGKASKEVKQNRRHDLRYKLCTKKYNDDSKKDYKWVFNKPWNTFTQDSREQLLHTVISFKQNLRVINKTVNYYEKLIKDSEGKLKKTLVKQTEGENWAIRKPMHKDTVSGLVTLTSVKKVNLSAALDDWENIVDKNLRKKISELVKLNYDKKLLQKFFKDRKNTWDEQDISKVDIYVSERTNVASRVSIDDSFNSKKIASITDSGIQKIMLNHLLKYNEYKGGAEIEHPDLAFSPDGLDEMNKNMVSLNNGKAHTPIYKVRTYEPQGNKFAIGQSGNKKDKFVEAAKGTNLYFAIYLDENGKRNYDTIPLNVVIDRLKQNLSPVPETNDKGHTFLMYLSPNDLVYLPTEEESLNKENIDFKILSKEQVNRIHKMVSSSGKQCFFTEDKIAVSIVDKFEFSALNKMEKSTSGIMIKEFCIKLKVDRLGNIKPS